MVLGIAQSDYKDKVDSSGFSQRWVADMDAVVEQYDLLIENLEAYGAWDQVPPEYMNPLPYYR